MADRDNRSDKKTRRAKALPPLDYPGTLIDKLVSGDTEGAPDDGGDDLRIAAWQASRMWDNRPIKLPPFVGGMVYSSPSPAPGASYSPSNYPSGGLFPLVRADGAYTPTISVFNRSAYSIDVSYQLRLPSGGLSKTHQKTIGPFAVDRYALASFEGSVTVVGHGEAYALQCMLEVRSASGKAVGIAEPAGSSGYVWHYLLGARDDGPGQDRSTIATYNFHDKDPIYLEYGLGFRQCSVTYMVKGKKVTEKKWVAGTSFEVKIPPLGMYAFRPYDKANEAFDDRIYVAANTGPNRTGKQVRHFTSAQFFEGTKDIAIHNYKSPHQTYASAALYPKGFEDWYRMYFVDVADDGKTRADRIHLKINRAATQIPFIYDFKLHFYDHAGKSVGAPQTVKLEGSFGVPDSLEVISPMKLLGKAFKGSVWVEGAEEEHMAGTLEGQILRAAPGKWRDLTDYAPPGSMFQGINCIPWIADTETDWRYRIALFYPGSSLAAAPPAPKDAPPPFSGPTTTIPSKPGGGWVFLAFYDAKGTYRGTYALDMKANETAIVSFDTDLGNYLKDFKGAVVISPCNVIAQCQIAAASGDAFGSTGNWLSKK